MDPGRGKRERDKKRRGEDDDGLSREKRKKRRMGVEAEVHLQWQNGGGGDGQTDRHTQRTLLSHRQDKNKNTFFKKSSKCFVIVSCFCDLSAMALLYTRLDVC